MNQWKKLLVLEYKRPYTIMVVYIVTWKETIKVLKFHTNNSSSFERGTSYLFKINEHQGRLLGEGNSIFCCTDSRENYFRCACRQKGSTVHSRFYTTNKKLIFLPKLNSKPEKCWIKPFLWILIFTVLQEIYHLPAWSILLPPGQGMQ